MLALNRRYLPRQEMHTGTADFVTTGSGEAALENENGQAPSLTTLGIGFARLSGNGDDVDEYLCFWQYAGGSSPTHVADRRQPATWGVKMRSPSTEFGGADDAEALQNFKDAVESFRDTHGQAIGCMYSSGKRYEAVQSKSGYTNVSTDAFTYDIKLANGTQVGAAFGARTSSTETVQHWVLYGAQPFDEVVCHERTTGGYTDLHDFLDAMSDQQDTAGVDFSHAVEQFTHYLDLPWI